MTNKIIIEGKPISVNQLYRGRRFLTNDGKRIKESMGWEIKRQWKHKILSCEISVLINLYYNDKRKRDIDNPIKGILDSMTSIVYEDDSQITELIVTKNIGEDKTEITIYERTNI